MKVRKWKKNLGESFPKSPIILFSFQTTNCFKTLLLDEIQYVQDAFAFKISAAKLYFEDNTPFSMSGIKSFDKGVPHP